MNWRYPDVSPIFISNYELFTMSSTDWLLYYIATKTTRISQYTTLHITIYRNTPKLPRPLAEVLPALIADQIGLRWL